MILILDIDETLIHSVSNEDELSRVDADLLVNSFNVFEYTVVRRPHVDEFLKRMMSDPYYRVGIWSAGTYDYVHAIVNKLIPDTSRLEFIMTRNDCNEVKDKPLAKVRDLYKRRYEDQVDMYGEYAVPFPPTTSDFLIIDDRPQVTGHDELNHLQIVPFEGEYDEELKRLLTYLDHHRYHTSEYLAANWY